MRQNYVVDVFNITFRVVHVYEFDILSINSYAHTNTHKN